MPPIAPLESTAHCRGHSFGQTAPRRPRVELQSHRKSPSLRPKQRAGIRPAEELDDRAWIEGCRHDNNAEIVPSRPLHLTKEGKAEIEV